MGCKQQSAIYVLAPFLPLCFPGQMETELRIACKKTNAVMHIWTRTMPCQHIITNRPNMNTE